MEIDHCEGETSRKSEMIRCLSKGPLPTSVAKLSGSSRVIPSEKDFYFYNNFQEFKKPVEEIDKKSKNLLKIVGESENLFGKTIPLPDDKDVELDEDAALDWLVCVNDEICERFDVSLDEFKRLRQKEESGVRLMRVDDGEENGFQMVYGKKSKKLLGCSGRNVEEGEKGAQGVKVAIKVKPKIPFHIPSLPKPQNEYKIIVDNSNKPFRHAWADGSEDGSRLHPLEKLSVLDFVDQSDIIEAVEPLPLEVTPFTFVEEVKDLKQLAIKLRDVDEFAVDLEHNQYRSFQGLTCLMQISTRTEDFVIDTLKLRVQIGPHLREVFKDSTKRKVLHGADRDILWLQRDFGIYICNMFDTGQASRVLKMERHSLEYLLNHFCGVTANKEYQNADWRIRPLPHEMIKYAREDTHYLLYIYDLMRGRLLKASADPESSDPPLIEVYKRSYCICTQLYEKELLTDTSYLYIYGMHCTELNAQQLAIVSGLYNWRDKVARDDDESTGYVLPNRTLIEIAKQMPLTTSQLRRALKSKLPYVERHRDELVGIIRLSVQKAAAFEEAAKYLKEKRLEMANERNAMATEESEVLPSETPETLEDTDAVNNLNTVVENSPASRQHKDKSLDSGTSNAKVATDTHSHINSSYSAGATVQLLKKPNRAFGALFGSSAKRKFDADKKEREDTKLEQIKSTVSLPFHSFSGTVMDERLQSDVKESAKILEVPHQEDGSAPPPGSNLENIIVLDDDSDVEELGKANSNASSGKLVEDEEANSVSESEEEDEPMSLSDLSSSFQKIFPSLENSEVVDKSQASDCFLEVKPFDYEAARKQVKFGGGPKREAKKEGNDRRKDKKNCTAITMPFNDEGTTAADLPQGRRRQAFPASGNRSATFR